MRTFLIVLSFLALMTSNMQAQSRAQKKMLVTYFSVPEKDGVDASTGASRVVVEGKLFGSTEYVAKIIAEATGADLFQLKTVNAYPSLHKVLLDYAKEEADRKTYPKMESKINNFADYDVIFVGYPNWWYDMPMVIYRFFEEYDFSNKIIIPFCTHGGSGFSQSVETIEKLENKAQVMPIPAISRNRVEQSRKGIEEWLQSKGLLNNKR